MIVLEIACGTGIVTRRLRERLGPLGAVGGYRREQGDARLCARRSWSACADIEMAQGRCAQVAIRRRRVRCCWSAASASCSCRIGRQRSGRHGVCLPKAAFSCSTSGTASRENPHALANAEVLEAMFPGALRCSSGRRTTWATRCLLRELLAGARLPRDTHRNEADPRSSGADPRSVATGLIRGTPRATLIEQRAAARSRRRSDHVTEALSRARAETRIAVRRKPSSWRLWRSDRWRRLERWATRRGRTTRLSAERLAQADLR